MSTVPTGIYKMRTSNWYLLGGLFALVAIMLITAANHPSAPQFLSQAARQTDQRLLDTTQNSTLGFQQIFVLNLPARTDRRDAATLAADTTGLKVTFVDGITSVDTKALPPGAIEANLTQPVLGSWRGHLNAARMMIENNIASALILEDDIDWDIRIKDQMRTFAKASQLLIQPVVGSTDQFLDPTFPHGTEDSAHSPVDLYVDEVSTSAPVDSAYGDTSRWDLLWLGHCGAKFPAYGQKVSTARAVILDDATVPEKQHIEIQFGDSQLVDGYPDHTRVITRTYDNVCSLAYALSLQGARRLLYEAGLRRLDQAADLSFAKFCDGRDRGRPANMCLTVQPQLFQHHRPVGSKTAFSDISATDERENDQAYTRNIRWSTRFNLEKLINGQQDYIDQYEDGTKAHNPDWR